MTILQSSCCGVTAHRPSPCRKTAADSDGALSPPPPLHRRHGRSGDGIHPSTLWENRQGRLHELREESGQKSHAFVLLDGFAVIFPTSRILRNEVTEILNVQKNRP